MFKLKDKEISQFYSTLFCLFGCTDMSPINLQDTHGDDLLSAAFNGVLECVNLKPEELGDICIGKNL